jgi:transcriptional regulator
VYLPRQFDSQDPEMAVRIMRKHPFASLISNDDDGFPFVTHLPLHWQELLSNQELNNELEQRENSDFSQSFLLGHVAKPNPHWRYLQARPRALVTFLGPQAYLSPQVYPDLARVPTWNYVAVHAQVEATLIEDPLGKDRLLKKLIGDHEPAYAQQWMDLGTEFQHKMMAGIVAFELRIVTVECKLKINQHRPEAHARMLQMYEAGNEQERALAGWMRDLGLR